MQEENVDDDLRLTGRLVFLDCLFWYNALVSVFICGFFLAFEHAELILFFYSRSKIAFMYVLKVHGFQLDADQPDSALAVL